jgi:hypothetical protein
MILLLAIVVVVATGFLTASLSHTRGAPVRPLLGTTLRVGSSLAVIRIAFYFAISLFNYSDQRQVYGYLLMLVDALVELGAATALIGRQPGSVHLAAALIVPTSPLLGFAWARIRSQPPN